MIGRWGALLETGDIVAIVKAIGQERELYHPNVFVLLAWCLDSGQTLIMRNNKCAVLIELDSARLGLVCVLFGDNLYKT